MTSVYGGSSLNIAATSAADGNVGCFFNRASTWRCQIQTKSSNSSCSLPILYECFPERLLFPKHGIPLTRRGWVVQEHFLSRRTLHLFKRQIFWECDQRTACEIYPDGLPDGHQTTLSVVKRPATRAIWHLIVHKYSHTSLTLQRDKLVALAGLAKLIGSGSGVSYLAGMWRDRLEHQLCWTAWSSGIRTSNIVPTWSWASLNGNIDFPEDVDHSSTGSFLCIYVHDVWVKHASSNPYGDILSANLRLRCDHLLKGIICYGSGYETTVSIAGTSIQMIPVLDCEKEGDGIYQLHLYILPVWLNGEHQTEGLLLELSNGGKQGEYKRVGMFFFSNGEDCTKFEELLSVADCMAKDDEFVEIGFNEAGNRAYFIDIV